MAKEKGFNGYDNHGYDYQTEKGVDPISKTPGNERNTNPFLEENSVGTSSSLRTNNRTPFKILLVSLFFLVAAIIALGITLFIVINDDSAAAFEAIKVTTESPVETTTKPPTTGPTIAKTSRTMSRG
ncbi:uncharacterized protein LOC135155760 [Lytechinus pictus]|uniref:uncharacterized protein LOC135155760 n=1 Tax=Lytechinus pictus TaxID=7653 RepID=UPI0030B9D7CD